MSFNLVKSVCAMSHVLTRIPSWIASVGLCLEFLASKPRDMRPPKRGKPSLCVKNDMNKRSKRFTHAKTTTNLTDCKQKQNNQSASRNIQLHFFFHTKVCITWELSPPTAKQLNCLWNTETWWTLPRRWPSFFRNLLVECDGQKEWDHPISEVFTLW